MANDLSDESHGAELSRAPERRSFSQHAPKTHTALQQVTRTFFSYPDPLLAHIDSTSVAHPCASCPTEVHRRPSYCDAALVKAYR
jgi:hypothetical protein